MISEEIQKRIVNYMTRLEDIKPSGFSHNFINEWRYLTKLKEMVLQDQEKKIDGELEKNIEEAGLLDE